MNVEDLDIVKSCVHSIYPPQNYFLLQRQTS